MTEGSDLKVKREGTRISITWRNTSTDDVEKARELYVKLTKEGWLATLTSKDENKQQRILEFKPEYESLLFIPLSEGG